MRRRYDDFSIFQDGGRRHLGFFKFQTFNCRTAQEGRNAPQCEIWSKSVKPRRRYGDFWIFQDGGRPPSWILWCVFSDHPRRAFGGLYNCAKFGWNRYSSFDNMQVLVFRDLGLKTPIHAPKIGVFGGFDPLNGELSHRDPQKALPCAETRHMTYRSSKSVKQCRLGAIPRIK